MKNPLAAILIPGTVALAGVALLVFWTGFWMPEPLQARAPRMDGVPPPGPLKPPKRPVAGQPTRSDGVPSTLAGAWPWFRGRNLDAICDDGVRLARRWPAGGPQRLWTARLGDGYAAAAVSGGCVYVLDHAADEGVERLRGLSLQQRNRLADALGRLSPDAFDELDAVLRGLVEEPYGDLKDALRGLFADRRDELIAALRNDSLEDIDRSVDVVRSLSLDDGREIWRNTYPVIVPWHHGRSRTIPAVVGEHVISLGPKCHVACWDAGTGECRWLLDLVLDYGATVPPWYAGQCPLIDVETDRLILAPGGKALLIAVDYKTGEVLWESPNPRAWPMTHVSIVPMEWGGRRMYVYCGKGGVAGVAADDGSILWDTTAWQIGMATCPSPVIVGGGRIFLCGGYNAGSLMLQLAEQDGRLAAESLFALSPRQFSSEQQTPVLYEDHLFGVRQTDKQLVCLDLEGNQIWDSGRDKFGSGPYMIADGLIYVLDDAGRLTMAEATPAAYKPLAQATVIEDALQSWGPMAMVAGRLILRDMTRMVCLDVAQ
jgi:outer membrane protein assembly factor BamB